MQKQVLGGLKVGADIFQRETAELIAVLNFPASPNAYRSLENLEDLKTTGLILTARLDRISNIGLLARYVYSISDKTGIAGDQEWIAWQDLLYSIREFPAGFDRTHRLVAVFDWLAPDDYGPKVGGAHIFGGTSLSIVARAVSGAPYAPSQLYNEVTMAPASAVPNAPYNSGRRPWTYSVDLKLQKTIRAGNLQITPFLWVINLFDRDNVTAVYQGTGDPLSTDWLTTEAGEAYIDANQSIDPITGLNGADEYRLRERDPNNFNTPRQVYFGL